MPTRGTQLYENMNKQQREYTIKRIRQIEDDKIVRAKVNMPSLKTSVRTAIVSGDARLRKPKDIIEAAKARVIEGERMYGADVRFGLLDLFETPAAHKKALAAAKADQAKHVKTNERTRAFANRLIDRVGLGEFENGMDAITEMESYNPE